MRKYFNMIEVTLAIAIVALGMAGILALFPVGFQSARDSVGDNYVNDASQLFLSYIKLRAKEDISIPPATQTQVNIDSVWDDVIDVIPLTKPDAPTPSIDTTDPSLSVWTQAEVPNLYYCGTDGLFRIYSGSGLNDFKAGVRVWKTRIVSPILNQAGTAWIYNSPYYTEACGLNIEFSWPVEKPYAQRTKRFFYYEIFKTQL